MQELLVASNLRKTFKQSRKQRALSKSDLKVKVAVDDLSFKAYKKYLDKKQIDSKYVNYEFIDSILLTDNYKNKKELKGNG